MNRLEKSIRFRDSEKLALQTERTIGKAVQKHNPPDLFMPTRLRRIRILPIEPRRMLLTFSLPADIGRKSRLEIERPRPPENHVIHPRSSKIDVTDLNHDRLLILFRPNPMNDDRHRLQNPARSLKMLDRRKFVIKKIDQRRMKRIVLNHPLP